MKPVYLVAFDPGITTGVSVSRIELVEGVPTMRALRSYEIQSGELLGSLGAIFLGSKDCEIQIVVERFRPTHIGVKHQTMEYIGLIKGYVYARFGSNALVTMQNPNTRNFAAKRYGEVMSDYFISHSGDALMHAITYAYMILKIRKFNLELLEDLSRKSKTLW